MHDTVEDILLQVSGCLARLGVAQPLADGIMALIRNAAAPGTPVKRSAPPTIAQVARAFHKSSLRRTQFLGQRLVADGPWNMLLDLFAATEEGGHVSVSSLCLASGTPATTALRHIQLMEADGIVVRTEDPFDRRRAWVSPNPVTQDRMRAMIKEFCVPPPPSI